MVAKSLRVLMVEDSEDDAELIRLELGRAGFELDWRRVDTEAEYLAALEEPWDLIICDYQMPDFDGLRAFGLFRERQIDVPFIFVSGALGEERAVEAMRAGARDYLLKGNLARLNVIVKRELAEAEARAERRELETQFRHAQKMEAVGRLAGGVAHDFNNLLTVIMSFGQFVLDGIGKDEPAHADMEEVLKAAKRAEILTGQLLAFSRRKPVSPKIISINGLVDEMDRMLRRVVGEDVEVSVVPAPGLWSVRIDPPSLEQVIVNLVVNSRDAMPGGGKVTIETRNVTLEAQDDRGKMPPGEYVAVAVADDGIGMDQETQRKIFEPFFSTKGPGKGTGLGLSTCYGIVKQAGGFIWVDSEIGEGATFTIYLPRVMAAAEPSAAPPKPVSSHGSGTILIVEDDHQVRRLAVRALSRLGYEVIEASNGHEALTKSGTSSGPIDLLLTDVVMPEMNGRQVAERLLPLRPDMKVLYMSGYTADAIGDRGIVEPQEHLLQKPFTPDGLGRKVREVLDPSSSIGGPSSGR